MLNQNDLNLSYNYIKKQHAVFRFVILFITLFELAMTLRGAFFFNLTRPKLLLYFCSYVFLFVTSLAMFLVLHVFRDREQYRKWTVLAFYLYAFCLLAWGALVSCTDCIANGDSGITVFVTVSITAGVLILVKPIYFVSILTVCSTGLLIGVYTFRGFLFSSGFYINFLIFYIFAVFINMHNYRLSLREYESSERLRSLSYTDQLTGVYNRRQLDRQVNTYAQNGTAYLFMLMDVDNFKGINDTHGHATGDTCLIRLATELRERFGDRVYRFGGDEFAVISPLGQEETCRALDEMNDALRVAFENIDLHVSAGVYAANSRDSAGTVFICTDRALYAAKRGGKARWALYTGEDE